MGRPKTISDDEVLRVARDVFRAGGHSASTREVARAAGISEAILYQRFGTKDDLFFASMRPTGPDVERLLGPPDPPGDGRGYVLQAIVRVGEYFSDVIPLALRVMTHPSFDHGSFARAHPAAHDLLQRGLASRLESLARRGRIAASSPPAAARLLVSLAHDWALAGVFSHEAPARRVRHLKEMVDVVWHGLRLRRDERRNSRTI
jgi:AcrR family transcriptional regulator